MKKHLFTAVLLFLTIHLLSQEYSIEKLWSTDAIFKTPESVIYDQANNQIIVSNINGSPADKDNNGFISLLNIDGSLKKLMWVEGMNAPKGMAISQNKLYVSDIDQLIEIDIATAKIIRRYPNSSAQFMNDVCVNKLGEVFASDNQANIIFKLEEDKLIVWLKDGPLQRPNGIYSDENTLLIGMAGSLLKVDFQTKEATKYIENTGSIDGLEKVDETTFVISNWSGAIHLVSPDYEKKKLLDTSSQKIYAADIGYIKDEKIVLVPTFYDNRIFAYKLIKK